MCGCLQEHARCTQSVLVGVVNVTRTMVCMFCKVMSIMFHDVVVHSVDSQATSEWCRCTRVTMAQFGVCNLHHMVKHLQLHLRMAQSASGMPAKQMLPQLRLPSECQSNTGLMRLQCRHQPKKPSPAEQKVLYAHQLHT